MYSPKELRTLSSGAVQEDKVDMRKEYFTFKLSLNGYNYTFATNKTKEVMDILNKKAEELKDTEDYKHYNDIDEKEYID